MQKSNYVEMLTKVDSFEEMMSLMKEIGGGNNDRTGKGYPCHLYAPI